MAPWPQRRPELAKISPSQNYPKIALSAISGDPTAVTSVTNYFIFIERPWVNLSELKRGFLHHKMAPWPEMQVELTKKLLSQHHPQNSLFCSVRGSDSCYIGNQPFYFHWMTLSKGIRAQEGVPTSQSRSLTTNTAWIGQNNALPKSPENSTFRSVRGSDSYYIGNHPLYFH